MKGQKMSLSPTVMLYLLWLISEIGLAGLLGL